MDEASGLCRGCGRSADEIVEWSSAEDSRRKAIWAALPDRIDALGILITRLPWGHGQIIILSQRVSTTIRNMGHWMPWRRR